MRYGDLIKEVVQRSGKEREQFAQACGVSLTTLSRWENNVHFPKQHHWEKILEQNKPRPLKLEDCLRLPDQIDPVQKVIDAVVERLGGKVEAPREDRGAG